MTTTSKKITQPAKETTVSAQTSAQATLPEWFNQYIVTFSSGTAHSFLITGDISGATVQGYSQRRFLHDVLASRRAVVAVYNRARGITFATPSMKEAALELLGESQVAQAPAPSANPLTAALAAAGVGPQASAPADPFAAARSPLNALAVCERLLRAERAQGQMAVILDYADFICPGMDKAAMSADERQVLVTLLSWGQDDALARCENPVFLLCRDAGELHADLRSSSSGYKLIEVPLPNRAERLAYLTWYLATRAEQGAPIALVDLTAEELANLTAGLNLRNLEDVLLLGAIASGVTRNLVKTRKREIIAAEYSEVAEMIDPLPGGFTALGGMERLVRWARADLIEPLAQGRRDVPKGVLLVGPPGTGKTWFVSALAAEIGFNCVALRAENILGGVVGESERKLKRFLAFARALAPVLIFIDEIDQSDLSRRGNGSGNPVASNLFNQMLQFLSDESLRGETLVFFASNRPDLIDPALLRFGRMDAIIPVLLPDEEGREGILLAQSRRQEIALEKDAIVSLVAATRNYSAADLAAVVAKTRKLTLRAGRAQASQAEAEEALRLIRPATLESAERYTLLAVQACNDAEHLPPPYDSLLANRSRLQAQLDGQQETESRLPMRGERRW